MKINPKLLYDDYDNMTKCIRFEDGTQICYGIHTVLSYHNANVMSRLITFEKPFKEAPTVTCTIANTDNSLTDTGLNAKVSGTNANNFTAWIHTYHGGLSASYTRNVFWIAIGKWK